MAQDGNRGQPPPLRERSRFFFQFLYGYHSVGNSRLTTPLEMSLSSRRAYCWIRTHNYQLAKKYLFVILPATRCSYREVGLTVTSSIAWPPVGQIEFNPKNINPEESNVSNVFILYRRRVLKYTKYFTQIWKVTIVDL